MAACPRSRGRAFFDGAYPVVLCRNAFCFMAAPSVGRRSRQRQGVALYEGIKNGGLDFLKAAAGVFKAWRLPAVRRLFFFAVVRQVIKLLCFFVSVPNYRLRLVNKLPDYLSLSC